MVNAVKSLVASLNYSRFLTQLRRAENLRSSATATSISGRGHPLSIVRGACSTSSYSRSKMSSEQYTFGPYKIDQKEVFYSTHLSYAMVNLRPLVPDVLVCPKREVKRFIDLTFEETSDLWLAAQKVGSQLESYHQASSLTFAIQDGPQAGQTVPHVHIHIIPRKVADFEKNDEIYDALDVKEKELKDKLDLDKERKDRSLVEMAEEAEEYKKLLS